ncbi:MAG: cobalt ABC transporter permease [Siculibacillus sp.]|nr:cobalt ABC transporter permease [Siculibacillus sp.]
MMKLFTTLISAIGLAVALTVPALAHKVVVNAFVGGERIEGEIGFSDGAMAGGTPVEVLAEDGTKLGETMTDRDGAFVFVPTRAVTHIFRADLGGGHVATVRIEKADLPATLSGGTPEVARPATTAPAETRAIDAAPPVRPVAASEAEKAAILEAVRQELKPLRREISALKEKNDFQAILGGIGYIVGVFGLWFAVAARRRELRAG